MKRKPKIGEGHAKAAFRQGLDELRSALYPESNVAQKQVEPGIYGSPTMGEIADDRRGDIDRPERPSILGEKIAQAIRESKTMSRDDHEPERD
jgi:hypothetical protein